MSDSNCVTGRVKWFNNKRGFGFITAMTGDNVGVDVFAHHTKLATSNDQYMYLVEGEYVDFVMKQSSSPVASNGGESGELHRWEAEIITGVGGGKLMCETRYEARKKQ